MISKQNFWKKTAVAYWPLGVSLFLFLLLLFKNPFSDRTLIANFEPYPDPFHYLTPVRCFLSGHGWQLCRPHLDGVKPGVPPLYSLVLLPFLVINQDPRVFYLANIILSLVSLGLFYLVIKKIGLSQWAQLLVLAVFVTTYHLYWLPALVMAENLLLPLFLLFIYLLFQKNNLAKTMGAGVVIAAFYGTKYASLPLTVMGGGIYLLKTLFDRGQSRNQKGLQLSVLVLIAGGLFLVWGGGATVAMVLTRLQSVLNFAASTSSPESISVTQTVSTHTAWFSGDYFIDHAQFYFNSLLGKPTRVLWDIRSLYPLWLGVAAGLGLMMSLFEKKLRWLGVSLILLLIGQIGFMSFFYTTDSRYLYHLLPTVFIALAFYLHFLEKIWTQHKIQRLGQLFWLIILSFYLANNFTRLKSQIALNLKYKETPWAYEAVLNFNKFQAGLVGTKPVTLITLLPPYFIDFFNGGNYQVLPLSSLQDFRTQRAQVWGEPQDEDLQKIYQKRLSQGESLYLINYFVNASDQFRADFEEIKHQFQLVLVQEGCLGACNIYQLANFDKE